MDLSADTRTAILREEWRGENGIVTAYGFATLSDVAAWSAQQQQQAGGPTTSQLIAATEQGVPNNQYTEDQRAQYICQAGQAVMGVPQVIWVAFNEFQDFSNSEYGLVPTSVAPDLSNGASNVVYQAFQAWKPGTWAKDPANYCCRSHQLGCP